MWFLKNKYTDKYRFSSSDELRYKNIHKHMDSPPALLNGFNTHAHNMINVCRCNRSSPPIFLITQGFSMLKRFSHFVNTVTCQPYITTRPFPSGTGRSVSVLSVPPFFRLKISKTFVYTCGSVNLTRFQ